MQLKMVAFFLLIINFCLANEANYVSAVITNSTDYDVVIESRTSVATIMPANVAKHSTETIKVAFNTISGRAIIDLLDKSSRSALKTLLVVVNGPFSVSAAVCVPISSCQPGNPEINAKHDTVYFTL